MAIIRGASSALLPADAAPRTRWAVYFIAAACLELRGEAMASRSATLYHRDSKSFATLQAAAGKVGRYRARAFAVLEPCLSWLAYCWDDLAPFAPMKCSTTAVIPLAGGGVAEACASRPTGVIDVDLPAEIVV